MATAFPTDTYPLLQGAGSDDLDLGAQHEIMSDGTPHIWIVSSDEWRMRPLKFAPIDDEGAELLEQYLKDNVGTEFDLTVHGNTYTGYLWGKASSEKKDGWWWIDINFYGKKTA